MINTHSTDELKEYIRLNMPRPRWRPWYKAIDKIDASLAVGPIRVGKVRGLFRELTNGSRLKFAAYTWLRPEPPTFGPKDIATVRAASGLDHFENRVFSNRLGEAFNDLIRSHPKLELWIRRRMALLDYERPQEEAFQELKDHALSMRFALAQAFAAAPQNPRDANLIAREVCANALTAAAEAARLVLGRGACRFSANLMVPAALHNSLVPCLEPTAAVLKNAQKAADLWKELPGSTTDKCLVVLAETADANQVGFWVPLSRGDHRNYLPGAPTAYFGLRGSAVFSDDLPTLEGFSRTLLDRWKLYMTQDFQDHMFVSLPLVIHRPEDGGRKCIAVLNINASPQAQTEDGWRRAYHEEWLSLAPDRVAPFIEIALYAVNVQLETNDHSQRTEIDRSSAIWALPEKGENE